MKNALSKVNTNNTNQMRYDNLTFEVLDNHWTVTIDNEGSLGRKVVRYDRQGVIERESWYKELSEGGYILHSSRGDPAVIKYGYQGLLMAKIWYKDGKIHREGDPAYILYYPDGRIACEAWLENGQACRHDDLPHFMSYRYILTGTFCFDQMIDFPLELGRWTYEKAWLPPKWNAEQNFSWYYQYLHREDDKPAYIKYYPDGRKEVEVYAIEGKKICETRYPSVPP